jgi:DNA mismatch endonuclease (patch repair protein)
MSDIVDAATRSRMMAGIRGRNTRPELTVRRGLHRRGLRYRLHAKEVPGKPDIIFPAHRATVFVNGCFWHGHDCRLFRIPQTRAEFWSAKIASNRKRDAFVSAALAKAGWRQLTIWECAIRGQDIETVEKVIASADRWIRSKEQRLEVRGS